MEIVVREPQYSALRHWERDGASEFEERAFRPIDDKLAFGQLTPADAAEQLVAEAGRILKG